jgi:hypothetical protein
VHRIQSKQSACRTFGSSLFTVSHTLNCVNSLPEKSQNRFGSAAAYSTLCGHAHAKV